MRGTRWLLLVAMIAIVCGVGLTFRAQKKIRRDQAIAKPAPLPDNLDSTSQNWSFTETNHNQTTIELVAGDMKRTKDTSRVDLKDLVLKSHSKNGKTYNLIKSAAAKGCRVLNGGWMCVHQAVEAFRLITGIEPDVARIDTLRW